MPINMTDYKMIVHERVYNVLQIILDFDGGTRRGRDPATAEIH